MTKQKNKKTISGLKGIYKRKSTGKYEAHFSAFNSDKIHLGSFDTIEAAELVRIKFIDNLK